MNDILRSIVKWAEENKIVPEIYFQSISGGIYLVLTLHKHGKAISHDFYVPGGVLCLQNWDMFPMDEEVNCFIEEAKRGLLEGVVSDESNN